MHQAILKIGKSRFPVDLDTISDASIEQLRGELAEFPKGPVFIEVAPPHEWPVPQQEALWRLWTGIASQRSAKLRVGRTTYSEALDFALAVLVNGTDPRLFENRLSAAITAIRICYKAAAQIACVDQVHQKLKALGVIGIKRRDVERHLSCAASGATADSEDSGPNPTLIAADFLQRLRQRIQLSEQLEPDRRILHYHGGTFYSWSKCWRVVSHDEMRATVIKDLQDNSGINAITTSFVQNVLANLQGLGLVTGGDEPLPFFINEYGPPTNIERRKLLTFQNGMLDLDAVAAGQQPKLLDFDPSWFSTTLMPFDFNPNARCPQFLDFLSTALECDQHGRAVQPGDCRVSLLQEWFGYTLLCDSRFQKFLLMVGEGNDGKGVILNLWIKMLGTDNVSHVSLDQLSGRFGLQPLLGKLANICGDLCEIDIVAEGVLKRLTGEDNVTVDRKNLSLITMAPVVKLVFATNSLPRFQDKSRGIWRRLIVMPFRVSIEEGHENERLAHDLEQELPGILNWSLDGLRRLLANRGFSTCSICTAAKEDHQFDCDPVMQFLDEAGYFPVADPSVGYTITASSFYREYDEWCKEANRKPLSSNGFSRRIAKLPGVHRERESRADAQGKRAYFFRGIGRPIPLPPADAVDKLIEAEAIQAAGRNGAVTGNNAVTVDAVDVGQQSLCGTTSPPPPPPPPPPIPPTRPRPPARPPPRPARLRSRPSAVPGVRNHA